LLLASTADARPEILNWTHSRPTEVQRFEARVSSTDGSSAQIFDLGVPTPLSDGIYEASLEVGTEDVRIEMRAFGPGLVASAWTQPQVRAASTGGGGSGGGSNLVPVGAGTTIAPVAGASNRFDFSGNAVGSSNPPWFDTGANYSRVENDSLFDVIQISANRVLHTASTQTAIHSHTRGSQYVWTNFMLTGRMATDDPAGTLGVTTYSQYPSTDRYYRLVSHAGGSFVLEGRPGLSCSGSTDTGVVPSAGSWYRFEFDVVDQGGDNQIRAKVWRAGSAEPGSYQIDCRDSASDRPRQGTIGVYASGSGQKYWDDLEVIEAVVVSPTPPEPPILLQVVPVTP